MRRQELRTVIDILIKSNSTLSDSALLEVGCGAGYYGEHLSPKVKSYLSIDASPSMVLACRSNAVSARCSTIEQLEQKPAYDVVLFLGVLEFILDPTSALAAARTRLRNEGCVILLIPKFGWRGRLYSFWHNLQNCPTSYINHDLLGRYLREAELVVDECIDAGPMAICYRLVRSKNED